MSYEIYKVIHVLSIFIVIAAMTINFVGTPSKLSKIVNGVASLFILVGGMGLLARIGVSHGSGFPKWVWVKIVIWLFLAIGGPIMSKRLVAGKAKAHMLLVGLMGVAAILAIYKPF